MTIYPQPRHESGSKRFLFSCWYFYLDPSNASVPRAVGHEDDPDNYGGVAIFEVGTSSATTLTFYNNNMTQTELVSVGINAGDNYKIKATAENGDPNNGKPNQIVHSEILTVWRRLWVELDRMYVPNGLDNEGKPLPYQNGDQLADDFPPGIIAPGSHIATQLARACIVPQVFVSNEQVNVPGKEIVTNYNDLMGVRDIINHPPYRTVKNHDVAFWTLQVVSAFESWKPCGVNRGNITFMFNTRIEADYNTEGLTVGLDRIFSIVLLHEIGHALWLEEAEPKSSDPPNTTYGIMVNDVPLGTNLINDNDIFTVENIRDIQDMKSSDSLYDGYSGRPR